MDSTKALKELTKQLHGTHVYVMQLSSTLQLILATRTSKMTSLRGAAYAPIYHPFGQVISPLLHTHVPSSPYPPTSSVLKSSLSNYEITRSVPPIRPMVYSISTHQLFQPLLIPCSQTVRPWTFCLWKSSLGDKQSLTLTHPKISKPR